MKIAIPVMNNNGENSEISEHFGHSSYFAFIELDEKGNYNVEIRENPLVEHGPGELPKFLKDNGVDILVVRGIGRRALYFFENFGIKVFRGAKGSLKDIVNLIKNRELVDKEYEVREKLHKH